MTGAIVARCGLAVAAFGCFWISGPAAAIELTAAQAALYTTVSIFPPSATSMTVCYSFVCRRREMLDFTPADRSALSKILGTGRSSAAAERAAVQKAVIWFDRRMGPIIGTDKRVANADIRALDDKHNFDCWDTTRNTTSLLLVLQEWGLLKHHVVGDPHYRGNTLALQLPHNTAVLIDRATKTECGRVPMPSRRMSGRSWNGSERIERANRSSVWVTQIQGLGRRHRLAKPDQGPRRLHGVSIRTAAPLLFAIRMH